MKVDSNIKNFLDNRPDVVGALGYGSGVFKQTGYTDKDKPQIDLILIVDDMKEWHSKNFKLNRSDYSFTGKVFLKTAPKDMIKAGGKISYQSDIDYNDQKFKYGVIENVDFLESLLQWNTYYMAGRCQKPILKIKTNEEIENAIATNRKNALLLALILAYNNGIDEVGLYKTICSLSYIGDSRQKIAEDPNKINNVVVGSLDEFKKIYGNSELYSITNGKLHINGLKVMNEVMSLPKSILDIINTYELFSNYNVERIIEILSKMNHDESVTQTLKGIFTNGPVRSFSYGLAKVKKHFK